VIGTTLSHYRVTAKLGAGGMGEVYRASDQKLGREVAIKILPQEMAGDPERLLRLRREAQVLASLNHPNIAAIHGLEDAGAKPFLVMELVEGENLAAALGVPLPGLRVESPPPGGALAILDAHVLTLDRGSPRRKPSSLTTAASLLWERATRCERRPRGASFRRARPSGRSRIHRLPRAPGASLRLFEENDKGTIAEGKLGFLAVLSFDPRTSPAAELFDVEVDATILGGDVVFERNG